MQDVSLSSTSQSALSRTVLLVASFAAIGGFLYGCDSWLVPAL